MGVLEKDEFELVYKAFSYCRPIIQSLASSIKLDFYSGPPKIVLKLHQTLRKDVILPDDPMWFGVPWWYVESLTPHVYEYQRKNEPEPDYFTNTLQFCGDVCQTLYELIVDAGGIDREYRGPQRGMFEPPPRDTVDPQLLQFLDGSKPLNQYDENDCDYEQILTSWEEVVINYLQEWESLKSIPFGKLNSLLRIEYSNFICDNINFVRPMHEDMIAENFFPFPNKLNALDFPVRDRD